MKRNLCSTNNQVLHDSTMLQEYAINVHKQFINIHTSKKKKKKRKEKNVYNQVCN